MTLSALLLMIFSIAVLWGGLVVAVIHLVRSDHRRDAAAAAALDVAQVRDHTL